MSSNELNVSPKKNNASEFSAKVIISLRTSKEYFFSATLICKSEANRILIQKLLYV